MECHLKLDANERRIFPGLTEFGPATNRYARTADRELNSVSLSLPYGWGANFCWSTVLLSQREGRYQNTNRNYQQVDNFLDK